MAVRPGAPHRSHTRTRLAFADKATRELRKACTMAARRNSVQCVVGRNVRGSAVLRTTVGHPVATAYQGERQIRVLRTSPWSAEQPAASISRKHSGLDHLRGRVWPGCSSHEARVGPGPAGRMRGFGHRVLHEASWQPPRLLADGYPRQGRRYGGVAQGLAGPAVSIRDKGSSIAESVTTAPGTTGCSRLAFLLPNISPIGRIAAALVLFDKHHK